jgi:hypothetical protein
MKKSARFTRKTLCGLACIFWALNVAAQGGQTGPDTPEMGVQRTIDQLFDGLRKNDSTMAKATLGPKVRLLTVMEKDGQTVVQETPMSEFLKAVGTPRGVVLDERLLRYEIRIDGPLATAWTPYEFYVGDKFSHCGIDAFQLCQTAEGWKIIQITDTRRKENCAK